MLGEFSPSHWLIVGIVVVLLFGSKRLPDAARALGRSMRILKSETQGLRADAAPGADAASGADPAPMPAPLPDAIQEAAPGTAQDKRDRAARLREEAARIESTAPGAKNT
ncbi:MAG TPA: Sec-independent protein translocase subunit TatA [Spirillospora sp.]|nr:Sec-independent protein translocase subunit TatA [Spirillospora sp.]